MSYFTRIALLFISIGFVSSCTTLSRSRPKNSEWSTQILKMRLVAFLTLGLLFGYTASAAVPHMKVHKSEASSTEAQDSQSSTTVTTASSTATSPAKHLDNKAKSTETKVR